MWDCPAGELSREDFIDIYASFFEKGDACDFANIIFKVFDINGDGTIDFEEFLSALSITSKGTMDEKLEWAFQVYDVDNTGTINREKMKQIVRAMITMAGDKNPQEDDGNGMLSKEDFISAAKRGEGIIQALSFL
ncbi:Oidioi.mRNA.OKI2018_I69.chr2.g4441.t1.cds [Oikopleura dioica]|uniref:Oidioi.mRNA.OKI2018_I69.chr2.g4441.t1.cds n=1 Tax=Oikopleura dioica TaxID=34765 RepID=A0ABN7T2T4_OIKDI|nr:Oidioi.mRNA.OKI2018_I69.chr2.g4441.t1.cds [Oikopleura dioica]